MFQAKPSRTFHFSARARGSRRFKQARFARLGASPRVRQSACEKCVSGVEGGTDSNEAAGPLQRSKVGRGFDASAAHRRHRRGIKAPENIPQAEAVAKAMGAEIAASRPICDEGWPPDGTPDRQLGANGRAKTVFGVRISGAIQHVVGMKGARTIVAINKDQNAPISKSPITASSATFSKSCPPSPKSCKRRKARNAMRASGLYSSQ